MLITPDEINTIAYITPAPLADFKPSIIKTVEEVDLEIIIGKVLLATIQANPIGFPNLIESYVKPFMAYRIKYLTLRLKISDQNLTPDELASLLESMYQAELIAKANNSNLQSYVYNTYQITPTIVAGIIIKPVSNITITEEEINDMETPIAPYRAEATAGQAVFYLSNTLNASSLVFVNDSITDPDDYLGNGTDVLTFKTGLDEYDKVVVTF